jgi:hypothetical protein
MMQMLNINTVEEMRQIIDWIFFRPENSAKQFDGEVINVEIDDTLILLNISDHDLLDFNGLNCNDPTAEKCLEDYNEEKLKDFIANSKAFTLLNQFEPGLLMWQIEDQFDRCGRVYIREFKYFSFQDIMGTKAFFSEAAKVQEKHDRMVDIEKKLHENGTLKWD